MFSDSGGDGGRDLLVRENGELTIYQFKFWTGNVTSAPASRKSQIERSFISALQHDPDIWVLVVPAKLNDTMKKFVGNLHARKNVQDSVHDASRVKIELLDVLKLDQLLIKYPETIALIQHEDPAYRRILDQLEAQGLGPITNSKSLNQAIQAATDRIETGSVNWDARIDHRGGKSRILPVARHPQAQALEPIRTKYLFQFPTGDSSNDVSARFEQMLAFGSESVEVSRDHISAIDYEGPEIFRDSFAGDSETTSWLFTPQDIGVEALPHLLLLTSQDDDVVELPATALRATRGMYGGTYSFDCGSGLTATITADARSRHNWRASFSLSPKRIGVVEYLLAVENALAIQRATKLTLISPSGEEGTLSRSAPPEQRGSASTPSDLEILEASARDLVAIQRMRRQPLSMPEEMTGPNRMMLRTLRLALEGHLTPYPFREHRWILEDGASMEGQLAASAAGRGAGFTAQTTPEAVFEIGDNRITLPPLIYFHPSCMFSYVDETARKVRDVATNGEAFVMYSPPLLSGTPKTATPWGLPDITEPRTPRIEWEGSNEDVG